MSRYKVCINAALGNQFLVGAKLCKPTLFNNRKSVGIFQGCKPVGNGNGCSALNKPCESLLNLNFCFRVKGACCFVKDKDFRVFQYCTRNTYSLTLTTRKGVAVFTDNRVVAVGKLCYEFVCICRLSRGNNLVVVCISTGLPSIV